MTDPLVMIVSNCPTSSAHTLAKSMLSSKLVACVNISAPIQSLYVWEGELCEEEEVTLSMKTTASLQEKASQKIAQLHPYDVPEILSISISWAHQPYQKWVKEVTQHHDKPTKDHSP